VLSVVRHALARAGIDTPRKGAHQFRHALACEMLRQGAPPDIARFCAIAALRRQRSTRRSIWPRCAPALPWPGAVR
jgi:integrase